MTRHVTALVVDGAAEAARRLGAAGFPNDRVSVLASEAPREALQREPAREPAATKTEGAVAGGLIGAIAGGLVALACVPGGVVVAGPLVAFLGGAVAGAAAGGILGAFAALGVRREEAQRYRAFLDRGDVLVGVAVDDGAHESVAERVLREARPTTGPHVTGATSVG
jgi:hypothetical protein